MIRKVILVCLFAISAKACFPQGEICCYPGFPYLNEEPKPKTTPKPPECEPPACPQQARVEARVVQVVPVPSSALALPPAPPAPAAVLAPAPAAAPVGGPLIAGGPALLGGSGAPVLGGGPSLGVASPPLGLGGGYATGSGGPILGGGPSLVGEYVKAGGGGSAGAVSAPVLGGGSIGGGGSYASPAVTLG
ncbi:hypothetical protein V3C99_004628 [Haemonchus contortus]